MQKISQKVFGLLIFTVFSLFSTISYATHGGGGGGVSNDCSNLFAGGLQTHGSSSSKEIEFECRAKLVNNPSTVLTTKSVDNPSGSCPNTCVSSDCTASGIPANQIDAGSFKNQSGGSNFNVNNNQTKTIGSGGTDNYNRVRVKNNSTLNFTSHGANTEYKIDRLQLYNNSTVNFVPGDYWIREFLFGPDAKINVVGTGTVRIFVESDINSNDRAQFNYNSGVANAAKNFFLYGYGKIELKNDVKFVGFMYSKEKATLNHRVNFVGGILAEEIKIDHDSTVTYDSVARSSLDLGFLCPSAPSDITHFVLSHASTGIYCFNQQVTVTAYNNSSIYTNYDSTIVLDTGTGRGTWTKVSGNGSFSDATADDGQALYTFSASDNGVAVFNLEYTRGSSTVDIEVYEQSNTSIRDDDNSGSIAYYEHGLVLSENNFNTSNAPEGQVYNAVQTAGIADTLHLTAYGQTNPSTGACGIITSYNGGKPLKFWQDYIDPGTGTITETINGTSIGNSEGSAVSVTISFSNGEATASALYRDVGKIRINMKDENAGFPLNGSTSDFVVRPAKFGLSFTDNPGASDHTGPVYKKAGEAFTGVITAQDNDGNTTPNFGNESTLEKPVLSSSTLVLPTGGRNASGNDGAIGNGSNLSKTSPGIFESTALSFDEVGIIRITAQLASQNYMGVGGNTSTESGNVGRFIPDNFAVTGNTPSIASGYGGLSTFSYLGQVLPYSVKPQVSVTAKSSLGNTTENYKGDFFKLTTSSVTQSYASNSTEATFNTAAAESSNPTIVDNTNGTATITYNDGGGFIFEKVNGTDVTAFNAEIELSTNIIDTDNVAYATNPFKFGATTTGNGITFVGGNAIYQGRLNIFDAAGHEEIDLVLPIQVEYYDGNDYILNTADSFTAFTSSSNVGLNAEPIGLSTTVTVVPLVNGQGSIKLSPPDNGTKGNIVVTLLLEQLKANLSYLQHDWETDDNEDGVFDDNPAALATFGVYEGKKNIIFLEEITD